MQNDSRFPQPGLATRAEHSDNLRYIPAPPARRDTPFSLKEPTMNPLASPASIEQHLSWRYAVKKFDATKKIPAEQWALLEQSLVLSPSSFGLQLWKFIVVSDPALRAKLLPLSWNQNQVVDASHLVVFARRSSVTPKDAERLIARIAEVRSAPLASLDGYKNMMLGFVTNPQPGFDGGAWMARQVYIALGFFLSTAALLGVDACPMEGINTQGYDEVLGLGAQGYTSLCVATAGYRASDDAHAKLAKVRFPAAELIEHR
jgi:nitroreductase